MTKKRMLKNLLENFTELKSEFREMKELYENQFTKLNKPAKFLDVGEAAEFLNLSKSTLYTKVSKSQIPFMKRDKRLYFSERDLRGYIENGKSNIFSIDEDDSDINFGTRH